MGPQLLGPSGSQGADDSFAAASGVDVKDGSAWVHILLLGPATDNWQALLNGVCVNARCRSRTTTRIRSLLQWGTFAQDTQARVGDIL